MKTIPLSRGNADPFYRSGFSLLEIIVAMLLIGITGALMFPTLRTGLTESAVPVKRVQDEYGLIREMDRLTGLYRREILNDTLDISSFKTAHVDTSAYIDSTETGLVTLTGTTYGNTTSPNILRVTLSEGDVKLVTLFTE